MDDKKYISFKNAEEMEAFTELNRKRIDAERSARLKSVVSESIDAIKDAELKKVMFQFAAAMYQMGQDSPDDGELKENEIDYLIWIDDFKKAVKR